MSAPSRQPLPPSEAKARFKLLPPPWKMSGAKLTAEWQTQNFAAVKQLVRAVVRIADSEDHHPEVTFGWNRFRVTFTTHRPPGLSGKDFACAEKLSRAASRIDGVA